MQTIELLNSYQQLREKVVSVRKQLGYYIYTELSSLLEILNSEYRRLIKYQEHMQTSCTEYELRILSSKQQIYLKELNQGLRDSFKDWQREINVQFSEYFEASCQRHGCSHGLKIAPNDVKNWTARPETPKDTQLKEIQNLIGSAQMHIKSLHSLLSPISAENKLIGEFMRELTNLISWAIKNLESSCNAKAELSCFLDTLSSQGSNKEHAFDRLDPRDEKTPICS